MCDEQTELPACINFCAPQPTAQELAGGATCVTDYCDDDGFSQSDVFVCPDQWACVPAAPGDRFGTCAMTPSILLQGCDPPPEGPPCASGTYCRAFDSAFTRPSWIDSGFAGMCVLYRREGSLCNADYGAEGAAATLQCEPGTGCMLDVNNPQAGCPGGACRCYRPCTSDSDCPCDTANGDYRCLSEGGAQGVCSMCFRNRAECDTSQTAPVCCDGASECVELQGDVPAGTRQCCHPPGNSCNADGECCSDALCVSGECVACGEVGDTPPQGVGCCDDLVVRNSVCAVECHQTPNSACIDSPGCNSAWECTLQGDRCNTTPSESDDTCNGGDEDCDGAIDEDVDHDTCQIAPPGCQQGFTTASLTRCVDGENECALPFPPNWCQHDSDGEPLARQPASCYSSMVLCSSSSQCSPGERCGPSSGGCGVGVAGCCAVPGGTPAYQACCIYDSSIINICWEPGDTGG